MKKLSAFLLVPILVLIVLSSCSMEKRLYRNGWYSENSKKPEHIYKRDDVSATTDFTNEKSVTADSVSTQTKVDQNNASSNSKTVGAKNNPPIKAIISKIRNRTSRKSDNPARMPYAQAKKQMADKGCKPNALATAVYFMSWASVLSCWLGIGILLCIATLILAIFATNDVVKKGNCVDENLAIINDGKRICYITLIVAAILAAIALLTFVLLFAAFG